MPYLHKPSRVVPLEGGVNFRDLGGYQTQDGQQVRWRKLFRCGHLNSLTDNDVEALADLGVSQIHDFRRFEEQTNTPSRSFAPHPIETINDYNMAIGSLEPFWQVLRAGEMSNAQAHKIVVEGYRAGVEEVVPHYRRLFAALLANGEQATVFHCAAGKDRTGLAAALILLALGVSRQQVIDDYLLTREHFDVDSLIEKVEGHLRRAEIKTWQRSWLKPFCTVHPDNILVFLDEVDKRYGGVESYLRDAIGLQEPQLERLRLHYLM